MARASENAPESIQAVKLLRNAIQGVSQEFEARLKEEKECVKRLGGLYVIGTARHDSRRIDNQLRGRAGRQGRFV